MLIQEIIKRKRDCYSLTQAEIQQYIDGVSNDTVSEGQIAAMCMAIYLNKMSVEERSGLTLSMRDSGDVLNWDNTNLNGPVVDKHSTGGVGDVVSLILAPMLASCGAYVPMISGRGLGHTGGTLDKLSAIPNFDTFPSVDKLKHVIQSCGAAIIGQTERLAPADKRIYATRDITGTVESIDLITASILSKKLAEGLDCLVMDVKVGNGAFMSSYEESVALAKSIVDVANHSGCKTTALLTDMNEVLASSAGNALEVREAVNYLKGEQINPRLHEVNLALCAQLLVSAGLADDIEQAHAKLEQSLHIGKAAEYFANMVCAQGGPSDFMENTDKYLPKAAVVKPVFANQSGIITSIDTYKVGIAVIELGGGRRVATDNIDLSVGYDSILALGSKVDNKTPIAMIHAKDESSWQQAADAYLAALRIGENYQPNKVVYETIV